jgi:hypothetical protein
MDREITSSDAQTVGATQADKANGNPITKRRLSKAYLISQKPPKP